MDDILKSTTLEDEIQQNGLKKKNHNLLFILIKCTFQMKENYVQTARKIEFTSDFKM